MASTGIIPMELPDVHFRSIAEVKRAALQLNSVFRLLQDTNFTKPGS